MGGGEQAKDLVGTWKKLLCYCKNYAAVFVIAIACAAIGTILQLLGPDKLSEISKYIEEGLITGEIALDSIFRVGIILVFFYAASWILATVQHWIMALTAVAATLLGFVLMMLIMGRSQKYFVRQQRALGALNGHIEEIYAGHTVIKAYNGEEQAIKIFDEMNSGLRESAFKAHCLSGLMMPLMTFIGNFAYVAVCIVGGTMALNGTIDFSVIVAFVLYVRYFTQPLSQIAQSMQTLQSAAAAGERVFEFLEAEEMEDESDKVKKFENVKGAVDFEHVKFGYEDSDKTIIHDFSVSVKAGQKIAIVGPTGAGYLVV